MRSHVLQAIRPVRVASPSIIPTQYLRSPARRSPILKQLARAASSSSYTPRPRTASSSIPASRARVTPAAKPATSAAKPATPAAAATTPAAPTNPVLDPQAAMPPPATIEDVDPQLAAEIPTPESSSSGGTKAPSAAFTAALTGGPHGNGGNIDWSSSFHGLSTTPFSPETAAVLMQPLDKYDIEVKPDGIIYLPEIKYRRILCDAFGPGGWGVEARSDVLVGEKVIAREYALVADGKVISKAVGENPYFGPEQLPTAIEGCKSNALMRCCKDLGIASELWDPNFIRRFRKQNMVKLWVTHMTTKKKKAIWMKRGTEDEIPYPFEK